MVAGCLDADHLDAQQKTVPVAVSLLLLINDDIKIIIVCKRIGIGDDKADMGIDCSVFRDQFCNPFGPGMNQNLQLRFLFAGSGYGVCPCEE